MEIKKHRVLVFPAGTEIALEIHNALKDCKEFELIGATSVDCHADMVFKNCVNNMPFVDDDGFIDALNNVIDICGIEYVYPAHDSVLLTLTQNRWKINAEVVTSSRTTVEVCRNKNLTYDRLSVFGADFLPKVYKSADEVDEYPVFAKPAVGQGSEGVRMIYDTCEFIEVQNDEREYTICEYLPGKEYTVDCFTNREGNLLYARQRTRDRIRSGIAVRSHFVPISDEVYGMAKFINKHLSFNGAWFFQIKEAADHSLKLMEIAPRIAGTMGLSRNIGVNLPALTLYNMMGLDVEVFNNWNSILLDRAFISRYKTDIEYDRVYVDFDDTLIVNGKVNPYLIAFLYQAKGKGKKVYLLTKHKGNIFEDMRKYYLDISFFDGVISLGLDEEKSYYIPDNNSIFIDDSYVQRKKVHDECGIPVFEPCMVESLFDWSA